VELAGKPFHPRRNPVSDQPRTARGRVIASYRSSKSDGGVLMAGLLPLHDSADDQGALGVPMRCGFHCLDQEATRGSGLE